MKNFPLALQIWLVFAALIAGISAIVLSAMPVILRSFFTEEIYATIETAQSHIESGELPLMMRQRMETHRDMRTARHIIVLPDGHVIPDIRYPRDFLDLIRQQAVIQDETSGRYRYRIEDNTVFYVIRKVSWRNQPALLVSSMLDTYRDDLVSTLFGRLGLILGLVFSGSFIPSLLLARYLTRPLTILEHHVDDIARRQWNTPVPLERKDEIGQLARGIESMRTQLLLQEKNQQNLLQNISHALKTPVMVIRSYLQSINDGIFPKGNLEKTIETLQHEAEGLEKRVRDFLYFTKLEVLTDQDLARENLEVSSLITRSIERFRLRRPELSWIVSLEPAFVNGEKESLTILLENIFDNQVRYARTRIDIRLRKDDHIILFHISNDGPPLDEETRKNLFQPYRTGQRGEFGLGLAIARKIVSRHGGTLDIEDRTDRASFIIRLPF